MGYPVKRFRGALIAGFWLLATLAVARLDHASPARALWPAAVAVGVIVWLRHAAAGLACGVAAGALLLANGNPLAAMRLAAADHLFPSVEGPWRVGAIAFTLVLGSFAGMLERSGGFEALLRRRLAREGGGKGVLGGTYLVGTLCFFDGLASSLLSGRIARPLADRAGVSRERLAWVVDSTGSPVACVAFVSTWIATQLSLIEQGLRGAPFASDPYVMFFRSVPANAYCLLTLLLVPLAIRWDYQPRAMRRFAARVPDAGVSGHAAGAVTPRVALAPLGVLVAGILAGFVLLGAEPVNVLTVDGWRRAFSGDAGPYALVFGSVAGWFAAFAWFPSGRRREALEAAVHGAGSLLPALVVLVLAWTLGGMFGSLGTTRHLAGVLASGCPPGWLPLMVFAVGSTMAFTTGTSWGTMGLLMPLALPAALGAAHAAGVGPEAAQNLCVMVIGAVFGGATLGDHCSPFSDTTIVSALASGCETVDHVTSQLPFAATAALAACGAYSGMAAGLSPVAATGLAAGGMAAWIRWLARRRPQP